MGDVKIAQIEISQLHKLKNLLIHLTSFYKSVESANFGLDFCCVSSLKDSGTTMPACEAINIARSSGERDDSCRRNEEIRQNV